jgi:hypothetical protein
MVQQSFVSPGLMNGDQLVGTAVCAGALVSGGYTVLATNAPDLEKLIPSLNFPSDPQTWTVMVVANAATQAFVLTVFATCAS